MSSLFRQLPRPAFLGLLLGVGFGIWNLIATFLYPVADDTPIALLKFYGPMFAIWGVAGFESSRRTGRVWDGVKAGTTVAFITFVVFDLANFVRVNLFLESISQRADWQNVMLKFKASGFDSLRMYANYLGLLGAPFKIFVASIIGGITGLIGGFFGRFFGCREIGQIPESNATSPSE